MMKTIAIIIIIIIIIVKWVQESAFAFIVL